jgi:hypothetical protein
MAAVIHDLVALAMLAGAGGCFFDVARDFAAWRKGGPP